VLGVLQLMLLLLLLLLLLSGVCNFYAAFNSFSAAGLLTSPLGTQVRTTAAAAGSCRAAAAAAAAVAATAVAAVSAAAAAVSFNREEQQSCNCSFAYSQAAWLSLTRLSKTGSPTLGDMLCRAVLCRAVPCCVFWVGKTSSRLGCFSDQSGGYVAVQLHVVPPRVHSCDVLCHALVCHAVTSCCAMLWCVMQSLDEQGSALMAFFNDNSVISHLKDIANRVLIREYTQQHI
jgi:hypothetical protein